jgi:hypothetical protein
MELSWGSRCYGDYFPNYAGNKHKSFQVMIIHIFEILDKAKPNTKIVRGLNLAVVNNMTVIANKMPL